MGWSTGSDDGRPERENMEERGILESIVFAYLVSEKEMTPIQARKTVETMTDEEIEKFLK